MGIHRWKRKYRQRLWNYLLYITFKYRIDQYYYLFFDPDVGRLYAKRLFQGNPGLGLWGLVCQGWVVADYFNPQAGGMAVARPYGFD